MRGLILVAALASVALPTAAVADVRPLAECGAILPPAELPSKERQLTPDDLVRLRDVGPIEAEYFGDPLFTISPDGRWAAFQLRQGDAERNAYCLAMVIVDLSGKAAPKIVDEGTEPILFTLDLRGILVPNGSMRVITTRWSSDGRWIAFLKRSGGTTQVWRAFADGSGSAPVTHSDVDVVDFQIAPDGSSIAYATLPGLERQRRDNQKEGLSGWHYDDRFAPWISKWPMAHGPVERKVEVLDGRSGRVRAPTPDEAALVSTDHSLIALGGPASIVGSTELEIAATDLTGGAQPGAFHARMADGATVTCTAPACQGAMRPWRVPGSTHVGFFRREGWADASTAIYDWDLRSGQVRRLYLTEDVLSSCTPTRQSLICFVDSSLAPRRLVSLDPVTGKRRTLFDPNPEFGRLTLGKPERLHWRNAFGVETIADLVYPVGYRPGHRYPMVVVQYETRGFLRGGTGDEYPIQAFANRGYAVLSFRRPRSPADQKRPKDFDQAGRFDLEHFTDRRNVESSLEIAVRSVIDRGIADPKRIGITGLSDGSSTVEWALDHSSIFSAAAMSSCCWDPTFTSRVGPASTRHFMSEGYPGILERDDPFWKDMSLEVNARRLSTPILVSASDEEMISALETYTGLREAGVPIDMFVFPNEYHIRWQPAHRLATYRRSLDWFDYWLRGIRSTAPDRQSEIREWDRLKRESADRKAR